MIKQKTKIKVEVSARHIHLSQADLDKLFGKGYDLKKLKDLSQPGEFAAKEKVLANKDYSFRIIGPVRKESQIELSQTDAIKLKINPAIKLSGDLKNVKTLLEVKGQKGKAKVKVIIPQRHIHCSPAEARKVGLKNNAKVKVQIAGDRGLIFENVIVRVHENYSLSCHIDTDEANAAGLGKVCGIGHIVK